VGLAQPHCKQPLVTAGMSSEFVPRDELLQIFRAAVRERDRLSVTGWRIRMFSWIMGRPDWALGSPYGVGHS
jgi:hypothetical protein